MRRLFLISFGLGLAFAAPPAWAQTYSQQMQLNAGYGRTPGQENRPVDPSTRDANGNRVIINGVIQTGADQSLYGGAAAGVGGLTATAVGNQLTVITQGSWNTVVVDSTQINNGDVSASVEVNGQVSLDAPH